jgi:CTP:molybdopterin cytidylyltransferase MocA
VPLEAYNIGAIVLAAGMGRRIGSPKALLPFGNLTFLAHILGELRAAAIHKITVIVSESICDRIAQTAADCHIVINPRADADMLSSIRLGVNSAADVAGLLIVPVDYPYVQTATFGRLAATFMLQPECVVIPEYQQQHGHPILVPLEWARTHLFAAELCDLRTAIKNSGVSIQFVAVDDAGILRNINLLSDLPPAEIVNSLH